MLSSEVASVSNYRYTLQELLSKARNAKPHGGIEPAIAPSDFNGAIELLGRRPGSKSVINPQSHYAAIETACRDTFYALVVSPVRIVMPYQYAKRVGFNACGGYSVQRSVEFT